MDTSNTMNVSNGSVSVSEEPQKERIVSLASSRFFQEGFSKITLDELASELAMSKKTLYKFFANKEDLLNTVVDRLMMEARQRLSSIMGSQKSFVEKLSEILTFLGQLVRRVSKPFQRDLQLHAPEVWTRVEEFRRLRITEVFGRLIDQGIDEGYIRRDINRRVFFLSYLGAIENVVRPAVLTNESFSGHEAIEAIIRMFFEGILTTEGRQELLQQDQIHHG